MSLGERALVVSGLLADWKVASTFVAQVLSRAVPVLPALLSLFGAVER